MNAPVLYVPAPPPVRRAAIAAAKTGAVVGTGTAVATGAYLGLVAAWTWATALLPIPVLLLAAGLVLAVVGLPASSWRASRRVQHSPSYGYCGRPAVDVAVHVHVRVR